MARSAATSSPPRPSCTPATAASYPRSRRGGTSSSSRRSCARRSDEAGATLDDVDTVAVTQGPGLVGALLVGVSAAKALAWARGLPLAPVDHLHGHVASLFLGARSGRAAVSVPARERRAHSAAGRPRPRRLHGARHLDRRRGRGGVRQGGAAAGAGLPGRPRDRRARARGGRRCVLVPGRAARRARLLVLGREDGAALHRPRPRRRRPRLGKPISPRRTSARSSGRSSSARGRLPSRRGTSRSPSSAASPRTRSCANRCPAPASRRSRSAPTTRR